MGFVEWICLGCFMLQEFKRKVLVLDIYETVTSNILPKMKNLRMYSSSYLRKCYVNYNLD